jgi:ketosteroid isomerase-like protein
MSAATAPEPNTVEQAVLAANRQFYAAFESLDLEEMENIWLHEDWIECVHPGWNLMLGWDEVHDSWARIFANTQRFKLALSSIWVHVESDVAWVACTEHVTSLFAGGFDEALVQALNLFVLRNGKWRMAAHHASPLPAPHEPSVQ